MNEKGTGLPQRTTFFAFATMVLIGGLNIVAVKFSNRELPPFYGAAVRFAAASILLFGFVALRRIRLPRGRALFGTLIYGVLSFTGAYAFAYLALTRLSAGVAAIVMASVPLLTLFFAFIHRVEGFRLRGLAGAVLAIAGIAILIGAPANARIAVPSLLAMIGAAMCAAESGVVLKLYPPSHPVATNAVAMSTGTLFLFLLSAVSGERWIVPAPSTWILLTYLVVAGSVGLFGIYLYTLKRWTASGVSYMFVLTPIVTSVAGAVLAKEPITASLVLGGIVVAAGVYVGALSGHGQTRSAPTDATPPQAGGHREVATEAG